jgi:hypothetical protein
MPTILRVDLGKLQSDVHSICCPFFQNWAAMANIKFAFGGLVDI